MNVYIFAGVLIFCVGVESMASKHVNSRGKRSTLSLPTSSTVKWAVDFYVPVVPLLNTTNTYLQWQVSLYTSVPNRTQIEELYDSLASFGDEKNIEIDHDFVEEQRDNHERRQAFDYIEGIFHSFGLDGHTCMRRAICELSEAPLANYGLLGKALHILLTPSLKEFPEEMAPYFGANGKRLDAEMEDHLDFIGNKIHDEYAEAYHKGKEGKCATHYSGCFISIFKLLNI